MQENSPTSKLNRPGFSGDSFRLSVSVNLSTRPSCRGEQILSVEIPR